MEKKNVLHTEQVRIKNRRYYLDLKVAENGTPFLVINQTESDVDGVRARAKIVVFEEDIEGFSEALIRTLIHFPKKNTEKIDDEYIAKVREEHPNAFQRWSKEDEQMLKDLYQEGHQVEELMVHFKRNEKGIISRLTMMGIVVNTVATAA